MVKHYVNSSQNSWDRYLPFLKFAYNSTIHESTKCTPFKLFFSRCSDPTVPLDLVYGTPSEDRKLQCKQIYCREQEEKSKKIFDIVHYHLNRAESTHQYFHEKKGIVPRTYESGELVLREYSPIASTKLGQKYVGPYVVSKMMGTHNVEIIKNGSPLVVHVACLKPWKEQVMRGNTATLEKN